MNWARLPWIGSEARIERQAIRWLAEMSDDPDRHRPGLEQWLAGDPRRKIVYDALARDLDDLTLAAAAFERAPASAAPRASRRYPVMIPLAACLSLVLCGLLALHVVENRWPGPPAALPTPSVLATPSGDRRTLRLADGSSVLLDGDSAITVQFTPAERMITLLRGRARFAVAHDPSRPFRVDAAGGTVTATGTLFDVWIRPDQQVRVMLLRGSIEVRGHTSDGLPRPAMLRPGQHLFYPTAAQAAVSMTAPAPAPPSDRAWPDETIDFDYAPLSEVLLETNRRGAIPIVLADPALGSISVYGRFRLDDPERVAAILARSLDLDLHRIPGRLILSARQARK